MSRTHAHPLRRSLERSWPALSLPLGWKSAGVLALLCSGVAWASLPRVVAMPLDQQRQWQALGVAPLSNGGSSGMPMAPTDAVATVDFVPKRAAPTSAPIIAPVAPVQRRDRCESAAGSATGSTGRYARPAPRRKSRRNTSPLSQRRSTSAT